MPYSKNNPPTFSKNMPAGAQRIAIDTANAILNEGGKEEDAIRAAISNVKKEYKKSGDKWVPKAALAEIELIITKANVGADGSLRWAATTSDTGPDKAGESASMALFQNWIERVEGSKPPTDFLPEPRIPFLGVSHYPSLDGYGEAGPTEKMYIDGNRFKGAGSFYSDEDHPIGKALFEALCEEQAQIKKGIEIDEPMRISAAWWDLQHSHGDFVFTRKNLTDVCPLCAKGQPRHFLDGQLDHWAVTRVPMNPRTDLELEEKSMAAKKTRKEDATTIIGAEVAEELEERAVLVGRSDVEEAQEALVIKTDDNTEPDVEKAAMKTVGGKQYPASDFLVVEDSESPTTWHLQVKRNGKLDHGLMGAAWAALHEGYRGNKYEGPMKQEAIGKLEKLYASEKMELPTMKSETSEAEVTKTDEGMMERPFGGATDLTRARQWIAEQDKLNTTMDYWGMFDMVMQNIYMAEEGDKMAMMKQAITDFGDMVSAIKAGLSDASMVSLLSHPEPILTERSDNEMSEETTQPEAVQPQGDVFDQLREMVTGAMGAASREEAQEAIQKSFSNFAGVMRGQLDAKYPPNVEQIAREAAQSAVQPLAEKMDLIIAKFNQAPAPAQPVQKSMSYQHPVEQLQQPIKKSQISEIARKSVGLPV